MSSLRSLRAESIKVRIILKHQGFGSLFLSKLYILLLQNNESLTYYVGVTTDDLDNLAAETCAYMTIVHPDYSKLAARIAISNLHKRTSESFLEVATRMYTQIKDKIGRPAPMLADDVYEVIQKNADKIQAVLDFSRDFNYDYFGFKTLERAYLTKDGK